MKEIRQGDVYWFDVGPATGSVPAKIHSCVIVQCDSFNRSQIATTLVCPITSNMERALSPGNVTLKKGDARLQKPSVVNVSKVVTIDRIELDERIGRLPSPALASVLMVLRLVFEGN